MRRAADRAFVGIPTKRLSERQAAEITLASDFNRMRV
jgi:hypothetical protein